MMKLQSYLPLLKYACLGTIVVSLLGVGGCGDNNVALKKYIEDVKQRPAQPIKKMPVFEPVPVYTYSSTHRRSPFQRPMMDRREDAAPDLKRKKEPLEKFALDALQLVGFFTKDNHEWALIAVPDQSVHPVTVGNYLGQNHGKIVKMTDHEIKIEERVLMSDGWKPHEAVLVLKDESTPK